MNCRRSVVLTIFFIQLIKSLQVCKHNQISRKDHSGESICCSTVICLQGQKYDFCKHDQGYDTCSNCPEGTYHLDNINTAVMTMIIDPCITKPTCEQPEVKLENDRCVCDRSRGYYGNDENNCFLADVMCSTPGFELKNDGLCGPCEEGYFKAEPSADDICTPKTRCMDNQVIYNNGSTTTDRTCRMKLEDISAETLHFENKTTSYNDFVNQIQDTPISMSVILICSTISAVSVIAIICVIVLKKRKNLLIVTNSNISNNMRKEHKKSSENFTDEECRVLHDPTLPDSITDANPHETQNMIPSTDICYSDDDKRSVCSHNNNTDPKSISGHDEEETSNTLYNHDKDLLASADNSKSNINESMSLNNNSERNKNDTQGNWSNQSSVKNDKECLTRSIEFGPNGSVTSKETETCYKNNDKNKFTKYVVGDKATNAVSKENKRLEIVSSDIVNMAISKCNSINEALNMQNSENISNAETLDVNSNIKDIATVDNTESLDCIIQNRETPNAHSSATELNKTETDMKQTTISVIKQNSDNKNSDSRNGIYNKKRNEVCNVTSVAENEQTKNIPIRRKETKQHGSNPVSRTTKKDENIQTSISVGIKIIEDDSVPDYIDKRRRDYLNYVHQSANTNNNTNPTDPKVKDTEETYVKEIVQSETDNHSPEVGFSGTTACSKPKVAKVRPIPNTEQDSKRSLADTDEQNSQISNPECPHTNWKVVTSNAPRPADSATRSADGEDQHFTNNKRC